MDAAFAEHVAGFLSIRHGYGYPNKDATGVVKVPPFTRSADAVLPWLEKRSPWRADCGGEYGYMVQVWSGPSGDGICYATANAKTFPRAAVLAMLKAHGVAVTFEP